MDTTTIKAIVLVCSAMLCAINVRRKDQMLSATWGFCSGFVAQSFIHGI